MSQLFPPRKVFKAKLLMADIFVEPVGASYNLQCKFYILDSCLHLYVFINIYLYFQLITGYRNITLVVGINYSILKYILSI